MSGYTAHSWGFEISEDEWKALAEWEKQTFEKKPRYIYLGTMSDSEFEDFKKLWIKRLNDALGLESNS